MLNILKSHGRRIICATRHSLQGYRAAWRSEQALRMEAFLAAIMIPAAPFLAHDLTQLALLWLVIGLVIVTELLNTAIEAAIDRIGPEYHELSGRAKDIGSGAVMLSMILVLVIWGLVIADNYGPWQ